MFTTTTYDTAANSTMATRSGVSGGVIEIRDPTAQQALTGKRVDETVASLNRDVSTGRAGANALKPIFNEQEIKAGFEIVGALQRETGTFLNNRAREATAARLALEQELARPEGERDPARLAALQQQVTDSAVWAPGGTGRQVLTALAAAAGGNVIGSTSQFAQNMLINYVQQQGAGYIGKLVKEGSLIEGSPLHATLHAIVACAGSAASQQDCGSGALGAAASSLLTNLFNDIPDDATPEQKEAKRNLLTSLVSGIALAGGQEVATAVNRALSAVENNYLSSKEARQLDQELTECKASGGDCKSVIQKYLDISNKNSKELAEACTGGGVACVTWEELIQGGTNVANDPQSGQFRLDEKLKDPDVAAIVNYLNRSDLKFLKDNITEGDRLLSVISDPTSWPIAVMGGKAFITNAVNNTKEQLIAVGVGVGLGAGIQYGTPG